MITSEEGTPQGGPLSPLLANIYLDALDRELDQRGHSYCRYADDCNIYVNSQASFAKASAAKAAAERTLVLGTELDREASATAGERSQERNGKSLGTEVSGLSTEPQTANRNRAGEYRTAQNEGAGVMAWEPESNQ